MPFESQAQRRFMFARHPKIAKKWAKHTRNIKGLPEKVPEGMEKIEGGLADGMDPSEFDQDELFAGIKVEFEHTDDVMTAMEIAMDHLTEIPDYYTRLSDMEDGAKKDVGMSEVFKFKE